MPGPDLRSERLVLVRQTREAVLALLSGEDCGLLLAEGYPHADTLDGLRLGVEHGDPDWSQQGGWFVTLKEDGRVIGDCGTHGGVDDEGRVEIGYGLAAPWRGRGYGTEAVTALVDWSAGRPGVRVVEASVEVGNETSRRLLSRLGFTLVDTANSHWHFERPA